MADARYLLDTDVFIDHLRGAERLELSGHSYSVITRCELFAGRDDAESDVRRLLASHHQVAVSAEIAERAGRIRRSVRIDTPDALIAATALVHGHVLVTRNIKHFSNVPDLRIEGPR